MACCQPKKSDTSKISGQIDTIYTAPSDTSDWSTLNKYNKYSYLKDTDFFQNPLVVNGLKKFLANNYASYSEHVLYSDLIALEKEDNFLVVQVHQLHSGGFDSMIFIDIQARKFYLFWLPGEVRDKSNRIYGERPIPNIIQKI